MASAPRGQPLDPQMLRDCGVSAQQRKTILVVLQLLDRYIPSFDRVAPRAVRTHLAPVDVLVAILAVLAYVGEYRFDVALSAFHLFMHAAQRIAGFSVIKFRNRTDGTPTRRGMTVLTRNRQPPVRALSGLPLWWSSRRVCWRPQKQEKPAQKWSEDRRACPLVERSLDTSPSAGRAGTLGIPQVWAGPEAPTTVRTASSRTAMRPVPSIGLCSATTWLRFCKFVAPGESGLLVALDLCGVFSPNCDVHHMLSHILSAWIREVSHPGRDNPSISTGLAYKSLPGSPPPCPLACDIYCRLRLHGRPAAESAYAYRD